MIAIKSELESSLDGMTTRLQADLRYVLSPNNVDNMGMKTTTNKEDVLQEDDTKQDPSCLKKPKTNRKRRKCSQKFTKRLMSKMVKTQTY